MFDAPFDALGGPALPDDDPNGARVAIRSDQEAGMKFTATILILAATACATNPRAPGASDANGSGLGSVDGSGSGSGSGSNPPAVTDGTRIKARTSTTTTTSSDGASYSLSGFSGWYDSMRGEPCSPSIAADGVERCLPSMAGVYGSYFADSNCTIAGALVAASSCTPAPKYVAIPQPTGTCGSAPLGPHVFLSGAAVQAWSKSGTSCTMVTNYNVFPVNGAEISASSFAPMTTTTTTTP